MAATAAAPAATSSNKMGDNIGSKDKWSSFASEYRSLAVQPATQVVGPMLRHVDSMLPLSQATSFLDNGCGPGLVMESLIANYAATLPQDAGLRCADFSQGMIDVVEDVKKDSMANAKGAEAEAWGRVETEVIDACDMQTIADGSLSHLVANFVYFLLPDAAKALQEAYRGLQPGGVFAASSWQGSQWLDVMKCIKEVHADRAIPQLPVEWTSEAGAKGTLEQAGFKDVVTDTLEVGMEFETHEALVGTFMKLPPMRVQLDKMTEAEEKKANRVMIEALKGICPEAPGKLVGWSVVAVGRK